jgi:hypothetical protein
MDSHWSLHWGVSHPPSPPENLVGASSTLLVFTGTLCIEDKSQYFLIHHVANQGRRADKPPAKPLCYLKDAGQVGFIRRTWYCHLNFTDFKKSAKASC